MRHKRQSSFVPRFIEQIESEIALPAARKDENHAEANSKVNYGA
jgi:hypothetical protein